MTTWLFADLAIGNAMATTELEELCVPSETWTTTDTYEHNGKTMVQGTEFAVAGERGARFKFLSYVEGSDSCWINAIGGPHNVVMWRSFRPSQVTRITRLNPVAPRFPR